ncbi:MAG: hypothetical protein KTR29_11080 [Rhodothermaceae bacterium]|nr:hypothetical protein [Rhodothermaceae bacterium]
MRATLILLVLLFAVGCSTSKKIKPPTEELSVNPILGSWTEEESGDTIQFLSNGTFLIESGNVLAAINRFQNTERNRYTSRLLTMGRYEYLPDDELALHVTADWTGKGTGARRPADRRVESIITFTIESVGDSSLVLRHKSMTQGSEEDLSHTDELNFTLLFID